MENVEEIKNILDDYIRGNISPDECFCMMLSLIGFGACKTKFLSHVDALKIPHPRLYNQLINVHRAYFDVQEDEFSLPDRIDCAVENGFYENDSSLSEDIDLAFELDMEMAIKLSLQTSGPVSYANITKCKTKNLPPHHTKNIENSSADNDYQNVRTISQCTELLTGRNKSGDQGGVVNQATASKRKSKRNKKKGLSIPRAVSNPGIIYWLRRDLRLYDNPALVAASQSAAAVIPVFLWSDKEEHSPDVHAVGGASKYWLHMALQALNRDMIDKYNNPMVFKKSDNYLGDLLEIMKNSGAKTLIINDVYEPHLKKRDDQICKTLEAKGVTCQRFHSYLLHHPDSVQTESLCMRGIGSVTHFMECCRQSSTEPVGLPENPPVCLPASDMRPQSDCIEELGLGKLPRRKDGTVVLTFFLSIYLGFF